MSTTPLHPIAEKVGRYAYRLGEGEVHVERLLRALDRAYDGKAIPPETLFMSNRAAMWLKEDQ